MNFYIIIDSFLNRLNVSLVDHFLRNSVAVTLQWPREAGAVYNVNVLPLTEMNTAMSQDSFIVNLTVSYNVQQGRSLVVSLLPGNPPWQPDSVLS